MSMPDGQRPNILLILTDDQRFDTIGALGNPHIHTPNIDSLVRDGFAFPRHFCTTPICTPARAELLTGRFTYANGVSWFGKPINNALTLMPTAFRQAGYHTIHVGKWHNDGHPREKGYDETHCVFNSDNLNDYAQHGHWMRFATDHGEVEGHSTELFTDAAIEALRQTPSGRPWFCYLAYHAPHDPHHSPPPFDAMYDPVQMPLLANYMPEHPFDNGDMTIRDEQLENWPRTQDVMRHYLARYYGMISHLDANIGRLLGCLHAQGVLSNTAVIFTADQGLAVGSHGLLGKENMYDHSIASPLVLCGPGIGAGGRSHSMSHHVDLYPTLCELAGFACPLSARDGSSLMPIVRGEVRRVREHVLCQFYSPEEPTLPLRHTQRAIRTDDWKLIWYPLIGRYQLFHLRDDAHEMVDLLAPWRVRRRQAEDSGMQVWEKDRWAAVDMKPHYSKQLVDGIAQDMHRRLVAAMTAQNDPLLADGVPPRP